MLWIWSTEYTTTWISYYYSVRLLGGRILAMDANQLIDIIILYFHISYTSPPAYVTDIVLRTCTAQDFHQTI